MEIKAASSPPPSNSESHNSATQPIRAKLEVDDVTYGSNDNNNNNNGALDVFDQKPETKSQVVKGADYLERYQKRNANYARRLMAKYFSKNSLYGGNIFVDKMTIDEEIILSSRWPCTWTFVDPVQGFEDQNIESSTSKVETPNIIANGKHTPRKNG